MKISREQFIQIIRENSVSFQAESISPADKLSDLGIDSLGFVTTLYALEEQFDMVADDDFLENMSDMQTVADLISSFAQLGYEIEV